MANTPTSPDTTPDPATNNSDHKDAISERARKNVELAKKRARDAAERTSASAKKRPYTALAVTASALAAIGGAAYGIFRVTGKKKDDDQEPPHIKPSAT